MQPLIALDQFLNCFVYIKGDGFGMADETLSARLFRCYLQGLIGSIWYEWLDALLFFDPHHCYESWRSEIERHQLPSFYRRT